MGLFNELLNDLVENLKNNENLKDIKFLLSYSVTPKSNPITTVTTVLGIEGIHLEDGAVGDYLFTNSKGEVFGKKAKLTVSMQIYSPVKTGAIKCNEAFDLICNALVFDNIDYKLQGITCSKIIYDNKLSAFLLNCNITFNMYAGNETLLDKVSDIIVKGVY